MQYTPLVWTPDFDTAWSVNPGALTGINCFAPLQNGALASIGYANLFGAATLNGTISCVRLFRQVDGSVRMIAFSSNGIDEYDNAGTRTNRSAVLCTDATAWGNQIIAVGAGVATQSSTAGAFAALAGAPKARYIAANMDLVCMYDVDDGAGYANPDAVWWCALRNPTSWAPSAATQAGRTRLLSSPGRGRGIVAYRDGFVAFKENGFFVGKYVGPPKLMSWVPVSKRVGCIAPDAIVECDGKLYWPHWSGFWEWDGTNLTNIGLPVIQSWLSESSAVDLGDGRVPGPGAFTLFDVTASQGAADDVEGVVMFSAYSSKAGPNASRSLNYLYNVRTKRWARWLKQTSSAIATPITAPLMRGTTSDMQAFKADKTGRFWQVWNDTNPTLQSIRYPAQPTDAPLITTGLWGDQDASSRVSTLGLRHIRGTDALTAADVTGTVSGYQAEDRLVTLGSASMTYGPEKSALAGGLDAPFKEAQIIYAAGKKVILGGISPMQAKTGAR
jgi:hypothetical protein